VNIYDNIKRLEQKVSELETLIKEKHNASDNSIHNKDISNGSNVKEVSDSTRGLSGSKLDKQVGRQAMESSKKDSRQVSGKAKLTTK